MMLFTEPVIIPKSSDARLATARATSSGESRRPNGCSAATASSQFSSASWYSRWVRSSPSEAIQPIFSWFTRILLRNAAKAVLRAKVVNAALEAQKAR
jgi:hypothetical protein